MKKRIFSLLLVVVMMMALAVSVSAETPDQNQAIRFNSTDYSYFSDWSTDVYPTGRISWDVETSTLTLDNVYREGDLENDNLTVWFYQPPVNVTVELVGENRFRDLCIGTLPTWTEPTSEQNMTIVGTGSLEVRVLKAFGTLTVDAPTVFAEGVTFGTGLVIGSCDLTTEDIFEVWKEEGQTIDIRDGSLTIDVRISNWYDWAIESDYDFITENGYKAVDENGEPVSLNFTHTKYGDRYLATKADGSYAEYVEITNPNYVSNPFTDVPDDSFYYDPVLWALENGITTGASETTFNPNGQCQRAQVVTFLWRAAGSPEPESTVNPFTDVTESDFFYKAVLWAVENGITNGTTASTFSPYAACNRAAVVTFLYRAMGEPAYSTNTSPFSDVADPQAFYYDAVLWAVENGVTNGMGNGTFGISQICNRAQVVTFLYRTYTEN